MVRLQYLLGVLVMAIVFGHCERTNVTFPELDEVSSEERLDRLKEACSEVQPSQLVQDHAITLNHVLVNDEYKTLYCYIPKVACTNWKRIIAILDGRIKDSSEDINLKDLHTGAKRLISRYNSTEIQSRLKNYYKFMFVREPLKRLVSAYKDKFMRDRGYYIDIYAKEIIDVFRPRSSGLGNKNPPNWPTLEEFFRFILGQHPIQMDEHWMPMSTLCRPCDTVHYNYIGTMENVEEDSEDVLSELGVSSLVHFPKKQSKYINARGPSTEELLSEVPSSVIREIINRYRLDYTLFGYPMPKLD